MTLHVCSVVEGALWIFRIHSEWRYYSGMEVLLSSAVAYAEDSPDLRPSPESSRSF